MCKPSDARLILYTPDCSPRRTPGPQLVSALALYCPLTVRRTLVPLQAELGCDNVAQRTRTQHLSPKL